MYCRVCKYDLRGQVEFRCPECGTQFDPNFAGSYLDHLPTIWERLPRFRGSALRISIIALLTLLFIASQFAVPSLIRCYQITYLMIGSQVNLKRVIDDWREEGEEDPTHGHFNKERSKGRLPAAISPAQEATVIRARFALRDRIEDSLMHSVPIAIYGILMGLMIRRRIKRVFLLVGVFALLYTFIAPASTTTLGEGIYPASHKYLDDYVYVSGLDWNVDSRLKASTIAAYEVSPVRGSPCAVALMNGEVLAMTVEDRDALLNFNASNECLNVREFLRVLEMPRQQEFLKQQQLQQQAQRKSGRGN